MSDASGFNDILTFSTRLQRRLFEGWAAAVGRGWHSPREDGFRQPLEIGEEMVKLCLKLQGDLARSAMKAWDPTVNEHAPQVPGLDVAREAVEACLGYQERAWGRLVRGHALGRTGAGRAGCSPHRGRDRVVADLGQARFRGSRAAEASHRGCHAVRDAGHPCTDTAQGAFGMWRPRGKRHERASDTRAVAVRGVRAGSRAGPV